MGIKEKTKENTKEKIVIYSFIFIHILLSFIAFILLIKKWNKLPNAIKIIVMLSFFIVFAPFFSIILLI